MRFGGFRGRRPALVLAFLASATTPCTWAHGDAPVVTTASAKTPAAPPAADRFTNGAASVDALVARFLEALAAKDKDTIRGLRVTETEYLDIVLPGSREPGRPPHEYDHHDQASRYFWSVLDTKSVYTEANLIAAWGGEPLKLKSIKYRKGTKEYAGYRAYKQLSLMLERKDGTEDELRIGSIAEVDGQYKFISYVRD